MSFWIFKCNPKQYRLSDRLLNANEAISWTVSRYKKEIKSGDTVFLLESGPKRAIRALIRLDSIPQDMGELESEQAFWEVRDTATKCRVLGTIVQRFHLPVEDLSGVPGLEDLSILHGWQQATNFKVTDDEGPVLMRLIEQLS